MIFIIKCFNIVFIILFLFNSVMVSQTLTDTKVKRTFYPNGNIKTQGEYLNDRLDGIYKEYYPNGKLWKAWNFKDGLEEGLSTWYFEDGIMSIEWNYHNELREGTSKWYYESGELWAVQNYYNDKLDGLTYTYYKTGELMGEWNYINGTLQDISRTYYKTGELEVERTFVNGIQDGKVNIYHENHKVALEALFRDMKRPMTSREIMAKISELYSKSYDFNNFSENFSQMYRKKLSNIKKYVFDDAPIEIKTVYGLRKWFSGDELKEDYKKRFIESTSNK